MCWVQAAGEGFIAQGFFRFFIKGAAWSALGSPAKTVKVPCSSWTSDGLFRSSTFMEICVPVWPSKRL